MAVLKTHYNLPIHPPIYISIHPSICPIIHPHIHPSIHQPIQPSIHLPIHPSTHQSIQPSTHPPTNLSNYPTIHPSLQLGIYPLLHRSFQSPSIHPLVTGCSVLLPQIGWRRKNVSGKREYRFVVTARCDLYGGAERNWNSHIQSIRLYSIVTQHRILASDPATLIVRSCICWWENVLCNPTPIPTFMHPHKHIQHIITQWSESASELYRPSGRRLSVKWLPTFTDRECHVVSVTDPYGRILGFLDRSLYFFIK
jgi:hypothetical protein